MQGSIQDEPAAGRPGAERDALVSVVMPAYNAADTIADSIRSVLAQSYRSLELIVVNDGSSDGTAGAVARFLGDARVRYFENGSNMGVALTRNVGVDAARGDFIAFCDADDRWLPHKLRVQIDTMAGRDVAICGSNAMRVGDDGKGRDTRYEGDVTYRDMLVRNYIVNSSGIYCARRLGKAYQRRIRHEDYDMWLRLFERSDAVVLRESLVIYRIAKYSLSGNKLKSILWHLNVQLKNGVPKRVMLGSFLRNALSRVRG